MDLSAAVGVTHEMKKTAGELSEMIAVEDKVEGTELRVTAWCPVCGKPFSILGHDLADLKTATVNSAVTHIRLSHPED